MATKATSGWLKIAADRQQQSQSPYTRTYLTEQYQTNNYSPRASDIYSGNYIIDATRKPIPQRISPLTGRATGTITINNKTYPVNATIENGEAVIPTKELDRVYAQAYKDMRPEGYEQTASGQSGSPGYSSSYTQTAGITYPSSQTKQRGVVDLSSYPKTFEGRAMALSALKTAAQQFNPTTTSEWIRKEKTLRGIVPVATAKLGLANLQRPEVRQEFKRAASSLMPSFSSVIPKQPQQNLFLDNPKPIGKRSQSYDVFFNKDINI